MKAIMNMKNKIQYLLFSLLFVAIAGCSDDDGLDTVTSSEPTNISVDFRGGSFPGSAALCRWC